jgi:uncharacterized linocin/CFP29 family protein
VENYRRDGFWDAATWADLDQVVQDQAQRVRVARQVFLTEDLSLTDGGAPNWLSTAQVQRASTAELHIPEQAAPPFIDISVAFQLTRTQVEGRLDAARSLARFAAKSLAEAEDNVVFAGGPFRRPGIFAANTNVQGVAPRGVFQRIVRGLAAPFTAAQELVNAVNQGIADLAANGWPEPYALILGQTLYGDAFLPLTTTASETAERQITSRVKYLRTTGALAAGEGILASLAGDPITIYSAQEAYTACTGEILTGRGPTYQFRVTERFQFVIRDPASVRRLA